MPWTDFLKRARFAVGGAIVAVAAALASPAGAQSAGNLAAEGASPAEAARAVVAELHAGLVAAAQLADFDARYEALKPLVESTHDLRYIAELTIRRQWRELPEAERDLFLAAFERLSVATYAARFAGVGPDTFSIDSEQMVDSGRVEVDAEIVRSEQPNVSLDYTLQDRDGAWRIVNILADGVSDLALKRAQYQKVFREGGTIDDLIAEIESEANALDED